jgi:hypothetical protein
MEAFIPVLISVTATLGLIALGIGLVVIVPLPSHANDGGIIPPPKSDREARLA